MVRYHFVLLATAALIANSNSISASTTSTLESIGSPTGVRLLTTKQNDVPTKRLLRAYGTTSDDNEERGNVMGLVPAGTSKLDDLVTSATLKTYEFLVKDLKLGDDLVTSVRSPQLLELSKFVKNNNRPASHISSVAPLSEKYGHDAVARALVKLERDADTHPELKIMVKQLRNEQLNDWRKNGESVGGVFKLLKLKDDGYEALHRHKFQALEDYIPTGRARRRSRMKAIDLETALLGKWRSEDLPVRGVWDRLKFSNSVHDALRSEKLKLLFKYISQYYPNGETVVLEMFTTKYGEDAVAKALVLAKRDAATKDIATKMQRQQLEGWLANRKTGDDVFKLLNIKDGIDHPKMEILAEFTKLFNVNKNPQDKAEMFTVLRKGFGDDGKFALMLTKAQKSRDTLVADIAKLYRKELFKQWFQYGIDPKTLHAKFRDANEREEVVTRYAAYYDKMTNPQVYTFNDPRRS
ncbi:hypothetical protein AM588_10007825 [Phytophthora nicotianae]|uniref:RxLR effector protein n=1 Tax=Phytophthora nicotianae TaxID=4792 RepID=A0A0W8D898_PHYNI|nr:hypothetical protein AM588_10007825 [Phytophthora nicotianae]